MNILITGAGGFIGRYLSEYLSRKHIIYRLYNSSNHKNKSKSLAVDLINKQLVENIFYDFAKDNRVDIIIHLASVLASDDDKGNTNILIKNIKISKNVALITKILNPKKLINFSSISVYPNIGGSYNETSIINPLPNNDCFYGLSKYCAEVIFEYNLIDKDINICHLRVANVYGKGMRKDRLIPMMKKELKEKNRITVYGNGERSSNFIDINKLINVIPLFFNNDLSGIYNIGDENVSYYELANRLINKYGDENSVIETLNKGSKEKFVLNTDKFNNLC